MRSYLIDLMNLSLAKDTGLNIDGNSYGCRSSIKLLWQRCHSNVSTQSSKIIIASVYLLKKLLYKVGPMYAVCSLVSADCSARASWHNASGCVHGQK